MQKDNNYGMTLLIFGMVMVFLLSSSLNSEENQLFSLLKLSPGILVATTGLILDILKGKPYGLEVSQEIT